MQPQSTVSKSMKLNIKTSIKLHLKTHILESRQVRNNAFVKKAY
jgi:hypothetical protein